MADKTILTPLGVYSGNDYEGKRYYQIQAEDSKGNLFIIGFTTDLCYTDTVEKSFNRLKPVAAPVVVEETQTVDTKGRQSCEGCQGETKTITPCHSQVRGYMEKEMEKQNDSGTKEN